MTAIAEGGQEIFMVAISALHSGKAGVQVATVQVALNALVKVGPSEPAGPFKPLLLDLNKGLEMILHGRTKRIRTVLPKPNISRIRCFWLS